ncbi:hypothetical protein AAFC00_006814 [Neodothiora populina]|uniref:Uncharacterized protein n=1 Tax=Neodothiora populina TaxID=2781224 RepID=A0ABR3PBN3_9PEZI
MYTGSLRSSTRVFARSTSTSPTSFMSWRAASSKSTTEHSIDTKQADSSNHETSDASSKSAEPAQPHTMTKKKKTMAELDEELRQKMSGLSGDGGESGVEYEDGQPVSMKRSVKNNMFRYI